jgi:hypothetical protein
MSSYTFSKRMRIAEYPIQVTNLNDRARNRVKNFLVSLTSRTSAIEGVDYATLAYWLWTDFHAGDAKHYSSYVSSGGVRGRSQRTDIDSTQSYEIIVQEILSDSEWSIFFDITEYIFNWIAKICKPDIINWMCEQINSELTKENVGYRAFFVTQLKETKFHPLTNENEQRTFEEAVNSTIDGVREHFIKASNLFRAQDFYGSAQEAVKALEAQLIRLGGNNNAGDALKNLKRKEFHPRLLDVAQKIYDYRNQVLGHGNPEPPKVSFSDAKFVLVTASALSSFLESVQQDNTK